MDRKAIDHLRSQTKLTQSALADLLNKACRLETGKKIRQKDLSLWVHGRRDFSPEIEATLKRLVIEHANIEESSDSFPLILSPKFSWSPDVFAKIWDAPHVVARAASVEVTADLFPSAAGLPDRVDARFAIRFEKLELRGERLFMDHCGSREGADGKPVPFELAIPCAIDPEHPSKPPADPPLERHDRQKLIDDGAFGLHEGRVPPEFGSGGIPPSLKRMQSRLREDLSVKEREVEGVWERKHLLAYELDNVEDGDTVTVYMRTDGAISLADDDFIGFPNYGDICLRELAIDVRFHGLKPDDRPKAQARMIRRTSFKQMSVRREEIGSLPPQSVGNNQNHRYAFRLLHPAAGFFYCLRWKYLELSAK